MGLFMGVRSVSPGLDLVLLSRLGSRGRTSRGEVLGVLGVWFFSLYDLSSSANSNDKHIS